MARVIRTQARVTKHSIVSATERAKEIVAEASAEAERIRASAAREAAALRGEAEERGRREGRASVAALETRALEARARSIDEAERTLVGLVTKIAERVLHATLADAPERVVPAVRAELARVKRAKHVELRVHPADAEALRAALARGEIFEPAAPTIVPDETVARGGCWIASDLGTIDARLEVQLAAFERALREAP
jgi:type III secretion system HrpE/YscL family protein